jgi:hypothetical protein
VDLAEEGVYLNYPGRHQQYKGYRQPGVGIGCAAQADPEQSYASVLLFHLLTVDGCCMGTVDVVNAR